MAIRITWNNARRIAAGLALLAASAAHAGTAIQSIHTPQSTGMGSPYWAVPKNKAPADPTVVYRSMDMGATWDVSVPLPTTSAEPPSIVGLAYSWDYIYVATDGEGVFRTDNGRYWEKWNDADVSFRYVTQGLGKIAVITTDGATFTATRDDFNNTFTQNHDIPLTATSVSIDIGIFFGTSDGKVYTFMNGDLFDTTDGQGSRPGPLPGAIRDIIKLPDYRVYVVEDSLGRNRVYSKSRHSFPFPFTRFYVDAAPVYIDAIAAAAGGVGIVTSEATQRLLYTCDDGDTWTEIPLPVSSGVNSFEMGGCNSPYPHWRIRLATDEGGFASQDQGATWTAYGDLDAEETGLLRTAHSDLGIRMISPTPGTAYVSQSMNRFELEVTNHGNERVEDVNVALEFMVWYEGSTQGSASWGSSVKMNDVECEPTVYSSCYIGRLDPGESVRIVWIHGLGANTFSMRLEAEVWSERLIDANLNNDKFEFSPNVRSASEIPNLNNGGGGSLGLWMLVVLLSWTRLAIILGRPLPGLHYAA